MVVSCKKHKDHSIASVPISKQIEVTDKMNERERIKSLDSLTGKVLSQKNDSASRNLLIKIAGKYYNSENYKKYHELSSIVYNLSLRDADTLHIAKSLHYLGDYYDVKSQMDSALYYYTKSEKLYRKLNDSLNTGRLQLYKAGILYNIAGYSESESITVDALRFLKTGTNTRLVYECYVQIALSLKELNNYNKSLEYFDAALKQLETLKAEGYDSKKITISKTACLNNIGQVYLKKEEYGYAKSFFEQALQTPDLKKNKPSLYAMLLNNLASSKMHLLDYKNVKELLFESLNIRQSEDLKQGIVSSTIKIGEFYLQNKDTVKALDYIRNGYELAKNINSNYDVLNALTLLAQNDKKNVTHYTNLYINANERIYQTERQTRDRFARISYETEQIEEKNKILIQKNTYIIIAAALAGIFLLALLYIYKLNATKKELLYKQEQQDANEKIYNLLLIQQSNADKARNDERKRIAMDLHDGIVNKVFTTRFNLMQLKTEEESKKLQLVEELHNTQEEIRKISHDLSENLLAKDIGFYEMTQEYLNTQRAESAINFDLYIDKFVNWINISGQIKINLYRIIQETVQNVRKHSGATECTIAIFFESKNLKIRIWDNGKGFDIRKNSNGIGLRNISERVSNINGTFKINSIINKGTTIDIKIEI